MIIGILLLMGIMETCWTYDEFRQLKVKSQFLSDGGTTCTIILPLERQRSRAVFDVLKKKVALMIGDLSNSSMNLQLLDFCELKALLVNSYQRNAFYVYACYSVP